LEQHVEQSKQPSRRKVVKGLVAAAVVGSVGDRMAQAQTTAATTKATQAGAASAPTTSTTQASDVTPDDVAVLEKIQGFHYTDADRKLMAADMPGNRKRLLSFRNRRIDPNIEPAVHFDPRLPDMKFPSGPSQVRFSMSKLGEVGSIDNAESLAFATITQLAPLLRARKITAIELTKMYLARLKKFGPRLLCVVNLTEERALREAAKADEEIAAGNYRGPLHGIPYGVKDLLAAKDAPTTWGVSPLKDQTFDYDATCVKRLADAGAVLVAKLSLGELAMGDVWFGGKTRNPWKPSEGSSGSSAGPCSATAAGLVAFAIGSETLGSIVSPCVVNGTTGLRPTYGRISRYGAMPLCRTMDKLGPITRGVEDTAIVLAAVHGPDGLDVTAADVPFNFDASSDLKSLRVGVQQAAFDEAAKGKDAARKKAYSEALEQVRALVGELKPIKLPEVKPYTGLAGLTIACESSSSFSELNHTGRLSELVQQESGSWPNTFRVGSTIPAADYLRAQQVRRQLMRDMADVTFRDVDCFVTIPYAGPTLAFTNLTGHPSLVTRCGATSDGLPIMLEFVGNLYREDAIVRLALAYEQATTWHEKWPDTEKVPELKG
jgi:Asp-tRNA(Asn)/Glu-tRNA(Gln) amidotransferase A subunit family amidase